jgi:hypothetical protein
VDLPEPGSNAAEQVGDASDLQPDAAALEDAQLSPNSSDAPADVAARDTADPQQLFSRSGRPLNKPRPYWKAPTAHVAHPTTHTIPIPDNFQQAMLWDSTNWAPAIQAEYGALQTMRVWKPVPLATLPRDTNIVGTRFVFAIKTKPDGSVDKYKARIVAQGFKQR